MDEQQLDIIQKIREGDENAFENIFRSYYANLCGYALKYLSDKDQAEEIVQEVFFNFWNKKNNIEIKGSLEAYLFRSVRNACLNYFKHLNVRHNYVLEQEPQLKQNENNFSDKVVELELQQKIESTIDQLPSERQKIFKMSRFEGLKYREIADKLGLSVKTVEVQMGKALKFLKENLSDYLSIIIAWLIGL